MLNHHIDLVPGQSVRVGNVRVTLVSVNGDQVAVEIDGDSGTELLMLSETSNAVSEELELALA
ncbi:MAG: hypothetical protein KDA91_04475 [Planctomycetaceae bacterium]|nr:hypothetical protein [Planctomycetaceae bacterium]